MKAIIRHEDKSEREKERDMGSRNQDQTTPYHQPLLSSLVVRASDSDGGGGGGDYEPGEVRRDPPPYSRSDRFSGDPALNVACCKIWGLDEGMCG